MTQEKNTGIWIDGSEAVIVSFHDDDEAVTTVESGIEGRERFKGETDQQGRFGDQYIDHERTRERRREHQVDKYLEEVIGHLSDSDGIVIFGPAETKTRLLKLLEKHPEIKKRVQSVKSADSMTRNQIVAMIRTHFNL